jgi:hypothetical protein
VNNNQAYTVLMKQLTDEDLVILEVIIDNIRIILASMYLDINQQKTLTCNRLR